MEGWIKLHRYLIDSDVFANPTTLKIWIWILIRATNKKRFVTVKIGTGFQDVELNPGDLLFGRFKAEEQLNIDGSTIYKHIHKLKDCGNIKLESNSHYTIISVCNWDTYQGVEIEKEQPNDSQITTPEQHRNNTVTTREHKQEYKEYKESKEKEIEEIYNFYPSKCPIGNRSTGKCKKDKDKISKMLNEKSKIVIISTITDYLENCKKTNTYIKNFGTFLNNFPEHEPSIKTNSVKKIPTKQLFE